MNWRQGALWRQSAGNTGWCLLGCSLGDFGTILWFQHYQPQTAMQEPMRVMLIATVAGILTSIVLETIILSKILPWAQAFRTAVGMSLISMLAMETAMNAVDYFATGGARLTWWAVPLMLAAGFLTPWPYNYWRLAQFGESCCKAPAPAPQPQPPAKPGNCCDTHKH